MLERMVCKLGRHGDTCGTGLAARRLCRRYLWRIGSPDGVRLVNGRWTSLRSRRTTWRP